MLTHCLYGWLVEATIWFLFFICFFHNDTGLAWKNASKAGFPFTRSLPGVQTGGLYNCECLNLLKCLNHYFPANSVCMKLSILKILARNYVHIELICFLAQYLEFFFLMFIYSLDLLRHYCKFRLIPPPHTFYFHIFIYTISTIISRAL